MSLNHILKGIPSRQRIQLYQKLQEIYASLAKDYESLPKPCTQCGKCCDFKNFGHKLYISSLEFAYAYENLGLPIAESLGLCPYQKGQHCTAREHRMLGCRTFFRLHEPYDEEKANELYETYLRKIKGLYREEALEWEYKDLLVFVSEMNEEPSSS